MKKLLVMTVIAAMSCAAPVLAQCEPADAPQGPCPIEQRCQRPAPEFGHPGRMHRPPHLDMKKFGEELKLTDAQKNQLKQLREKQMEAAKPIFEKLKANEKEAAELRKELRDLRVQHKKDFKSVLTDKQLKKLEQLKAERKQEFAKRHRADMHRRPQVIIQECKCPCAK